jgi:phosphohistidine phosphatase SixA
MADRGAPPRDRRLARARGVRRARCRESPHAAIAALTEHDEESIALVGHEPYLSSLASLLLAGDEDAVQIELKKGGVIFLSLESVAAPASAFLRWSLRPKILRSLAPAGWTTTAIPTQVDSFPRP